MRLIADITFRRGCKSDEAALNSLHPVVSGGAHWVYVCSLADATIAYPKEAGTVICIGEVSRAELPSGIDCIAGEPAVSTYYRDGHRLRLQLYHLGACDNCEDGKSEERRLVAAHVERYGAQPMGQEIPASINAYVAMAESNLSPEEEGAIDLTVASTDSSADPGSIDTAP